MWQTELEWRHQVLWGVCHILFKGWFGLLCGPCSRDFYAMTCVSICKWHQKASDWHPYPKQLLMYKVSVAGGWEGGGGGRVGGCYQFYLSVWLTYRREHLAGADAVVEAHPPVVVRVLARAENVLVSHVVRFLVEHAVAAADTEGVAVVEVPKGVHAVTAALPVAALEVAALVEDDLEERRERENTVYVRHKEMLSRRLVNRLSLPTLYTSLHIYLHCLTDEK